MKLMHISDLHLGKRLNEFSLIEDQKYILQEIVGLLRQEQPDALLIAGDVYDKGVPPTEAVRLFDDFLTQVSALGISVCVISGNHDSAERLSFAAQLLKSSGVHFNALYNGEPQVVTLQDEYGPVHIYLLPFLKPAVVRHALGEETVAISSYHEALQLAVARLQPDVTERNVLVAHQFVTGASPSGSEAVNVGGLDNIGAEVFADFDYVALGHIHGAQSVGERIRYCGTPLKYSFAEYQQQKSVTMVELGAKGSVEISTIELVPLRELRRLRGSYDELMRRSSYEALPKDSDERLHDFYQLTLTDENDVPDAAAKLRSVYKNLLQLEYDNARTRQHTQVEADEQLEQKSRLELVCEFFALQNNHELCAEQQEYVAALLERLEQQEVGA